MQTSSSFGSSLLSYIFMVIIHAGFPPVDGQMPCHDDTDCPASTFVCRDQICACDRFCEESRSPGERCATDIDCASVDLVCYGKGDFKACRCRKNLVWDLRYDKCLKDDGYFTSDPVQNFIIPAIIVMSVGAMIYLGIKLFCNCGKLWRRRRSELSRELEGIASSPHQQATWVASYRVFSPLNNQSQPPLHPTPCMGLFVPSLSASPPPYEEALKHKVILSSYHPATAVPPQLPVYTYEPPTPPEESMPQATVPQRGRIVGTTERDQIRPLRYYPGEGNPQIPAVWNGVHVTEVEELHQHISEVPREANRIANMSIFPGNRSTRGVRASRYYTPEPTRPPPGHESVDRGT